MTDLLSSLKKLQSYEKKLAESHSKAVLVGVISDQLTKRVYKDGTPLLEVAATNEYGEPRRKIPRRSFLKMTFEIKSNDINSFIQNQYKLVFEKGRSTTQALGLVGVKAKNLVAEAFNTGGFGRWKPLSQETIDARPKKTTTILIDTGTLRTSITWKVI